MPLYNFKSGAIQAIKPATFKDAGLKERSDIQRLLRDCIDVIAPDTLVLAEEFGDWEDANRRIDLLALDKNANLVVVELKRDDCGHMELQALRYAAMVAFMTWEKAVETYANYQAKMGNEVDAEGRLLNFLGWEDKSDDKFPQDVRIVLAASAFSKELTTTVMWLNQKQGIDIRCVKMQPYLVEGLVLVDAQQVIPLPEAAEYQTKIKEKDLQVAVAQASKKDMTRYNVTIADQVFPNLPKRRAMFEIVRSLINAGISPEDIATYTPMDPWLVLEGTPGPGEFRDLAVEKLIADGYDPNRIRRYFHEDAELFHVNGKTYSFFNNWGEDFAPTVKKFEVAFPGTFRCEPVS